MQSPVNNLTQIDQICNQYVADVANLCPEFATELGMDIKQDSWSDLSPAGLEALAQRDRQFLTDIQNATPANPVDRATVAAVTDRLGVSLRLEEMGENLRSLNNLASPVQTLRDNFALMDTSSGAGVENVRLRLLGLGQALAGYRQSLTLAAERSMVAAARQVQAVIGQCRDLAAPQSMLDNLVESAPADLNEQQWADMQDGLAQAARAAKVAFADLATWLEEELAPQAPAEDAFGRERYSVLSHHFVGAQLDLDEAYEWALDKLAQISTQQEEIAVQLYGPGTTIAQAIANLNNDPQRQLHGTAALQEWMQATADEAVKKLDGEFFDIPQQVKTIECCIDKSGTGGIYYTAPSEDFSRPGRMWWSVPPQETVFNTWSELTTVFHEGVPGHHLQIGQAMVEAASLNHWRRQVCWNSGHGEGWALYAEALMAELGFQDEPGGRMGMLDAQRLRAARVVLDIGVHLGKTVPEGGQVWNRDYAWDFLRRNVAMAEGFLAFELDRYLGWAGQAPSYLLGQRLWRQLREEYLQWAPGAGEEATWKAFHSKALKLGSLPMGILRQQVLS